MNFKTGKDIFSKEQLKVLVAFQKNWLTDNTIFANPKAKYGLLIANTRYGQFTINKPSKKLIQKDFKNLIVNENEDFYDFVDIIFDMIHKSFNSSVKLNEFVPNEHIARILFEAFEFIYMESILNMEDSSKRLYFRKHLVSEECFLNENIVDTYNYLTNPDNVFRNNKMLFSIFYKDYTNQIKDFYNNLPKKDI